MERNADLIKDCLAKNAFFLIIPILKIINVKVQKKCKKCKTLVRISKTKNKTLWAAESINAELKFTSQKVKTSKYSPSLLLEPFITFLNS